MVYADSSFLTSGYIRDAHISEFLRRMHARPVIQVTPLHRAEIAHAVHLHVFYKKISQKDAAQQFAEFENDCFTGVLKMIALPPHTWERAISLARRFASTHGIRTLDSLHVACALELGAHTFWTFDQRQARLAKAVGLKTKP